MSLLAQTATEVYDEAFRAGLKPDPLLTISEWADRYRRLSGKAAAEPGPWRTERTPYLREIMDSLSPSAPVERVVFMKGSQIGGTECGNNWVGYVIHKSPGPMMVVQPILVVAGDIYDRAVPPAEAVTLLDDVIARLTLDCRLPVILVPGNHDSPERLTFGARLLKAGNLHLFKQFGPTNIVTLADQHGPVDIYSVPFAEPPVARQELDCPAVVDHNTAIQEVVRRIRETRVAGRRSVLLAHGFVAGGEATESERPLVIGGAGAVEPAGLAGFSYVALGHLHRPQTAGQENIHYAGSILGYSFAEAGQVKSVNLVEIGAWGDCKVERLPLRPRHAVRCATGLFEDLKKGTAAGNAIDDYLMITLQDRGPVLDAMGQLRQIYPNLLHVQRADPVISGEAAAVRIDHRRISTDQLFSSFFRQVTGQDLTEAEAAAFAEVCQQSQIEMREAAC